VAESYRAHTLTLALGRCSIRDAKKPGADEVSVRGTFTVDGPPYVPSMDPRAGGVAFSIGAPGALAELDVPPSGVCEGHSGG
jgi:hypothetical protein